MYPQPVGTTAVRETQQIIMGTCKEHLIHRVFILCCHAGHTAAPAALLTAGVKRHPLDVVLRGQHHENLFVLNEIKNIHVRVGRIIDLCPAFVRILCADFGSLLLHH